MTQYIEKSALSSEIEKKFKYEETWMEKQGYTGYHQGLRDAYRNILSFLDTLEVIEVDLEKEIKNEIDEYWYDNDYGAIQRRGGTVTMEISDVKEIAKYFFELGLKAQKGK